MATERTGLPWYTLIVGIAITVGFGAMCFFILAKADTSGSTWDHYIIVFNAVQTLAAAAVGALLGTTIQQSKVDAANKATVAAEAKAASNQSEADKAKAARDLLSGLHAPGAAQPADNLAAVFAILR